jgi:hypothetical protein
MFAWLEKQLTAERKSNHPIPQTNRFIWSFLASLVASLTASGGQLHWSTLWALLPPALWVAAEQTAPSLPWNLILHYIAAAKLPPIVPPLSVPPQPAAAPLSESPSKEGI